MNQQQYERRRPNLPVRVPGAAHEREEALSRTVRPTRWLTGGAVGRATVKACCALPLESGGRCTRAPHHHGQCGGQR